jgi:hypothetical protein
MSHLPEEKQSHWMYYPTWLRPAFDMNLEQIDYMQFIPITTNKASTREILYGYSDPRHKVEADCYLNDSRFAEPKISE